MRDINKEKNWSPRFCSHPCLRMAAPAAAAVAVAGLEAGSAPKMALVATFMAELAAEGGEVDSEAISRLGRRRGRRSAGPGIGGERSLESGKENVQTDRHSVLEG